MTNASNGKKTIAKCVQTTPLTYLHSSQIITTIMKILLGRCCIIPKIPTKSGFLSNYKFLFVLFFWGGGGIFRRPKQQTKKKYNTKSVFLMVPHDSSRLLRSSPRHCKALEGQVLVRCLRRECLTRVSRRPSAWGVFGVFC